MSTAPHEITMWAGEWPIGDDDPFIGTERMPAGADPDSVSRFGASQWNLTSLSAHGHGGSRIVDWDRIEEPRLRSSFRRAGWALVNLPAPDELLERATMSRARWPGAETIRRHAGEWQRWAAWLAGRAH